ncbi:MAG: asparagine synthase-related protein [bacterium]|nr:asparagine synthase-related protein [bacterium]
MSEAIVHRGTQSFICKGPIGLMQRLPVFKKFNNTVHIEGRRYHILFDGDIFNKSVLTRLVGINPEISVEETEILLRLYLKFGKEFPRFIEGHFSLAIADDHQLYLARDQIGIKPLFYYFDEKRFVFGSEIKTLLQAMPATPEIDYQSLYTRTIFRDHLIGDATYLSGIKTFPQGYYCTVRQNENKKIVMDFKNYDVTNNITALPGAKNEEYQEMVRQAVERNVKYYVEKTDSVGILLSGGFDSSVLAAIAAQYTKGPLKTFTISDDPNFPDVLAARAVAKHLGTQHHEFIINATPSLFGLTKGIHAYEDSIYRNTIFELAQKMRGMVDIAISGTGADILGMPVLFRGSHITDIKKRWGLLANQKKELEIKTFMESFLESVERNPEDALYRHFLEHYIPNYLIPSTERALMYVGIESAFPFADTMLRTISPLLPAHLKYIKSEKRNGEEKKFLRDTFSYLNLPREIMERDKLCSKSNLQESKHNLKELTEWLLTDRDVAVHPLKRLLRRDKYGIACFEIFNYLFRKNKGILPSKLTLLYDVSRYLVARGRGKYVL